jgi:hypothetical protein
MHTTASLIYVVDPCSNLTLEVVTFRVMEKEPSLTHFHEIVDRLLKILYLTVPLRNSS